MVILAIIVIIACISYLTLSRVELGIGKKTKQITSDFPDAYDPHRTRQMEVEQGIKGELTKCGDKSCKICDWKSRMLTTDEPRFRVGRVVRTSLFQRRDKFINELVDGLSDELSDMMYEDFVGRLERELEIYRREDAEDKFHTDWKNIDWFHSEGCTFNPDTNSWSNKVSKASSIRTEKRRR